MIRITVGFGGREEKHFRLEKSWQISEAMQRGCTDGVPCHRDKKWRELVTNVFRAWGPNWNPSCSGSCSFSRGLHNAGFTEGLSYSRVTYLTCLVIASYMVLFTFISLNTCLPQNELYLFLTEGGCMKLCNCWNIPFAVSFEKSHIQFVLHEI